MAQDRFDKLFPNRAKPANIGSGLSTAERELLQYDQQRNGFSPNTTTSPAEGGDGEEDEDDYVLAQASTKTARRPKPRDRRQFGKTSNSSPDTLAFFPYGKGVVKPDDGDDYFIEPTSSNDELLGRFCPWNLVLKFPYKYMQDPQDKVSVEFFAAEKVYNRNWNMHYVRTPDQSNQLYLVPLEEVDSLMADIGAKFNLEISVPPFPFQISVYKGESVPIRLGNVNSKDDMVRLGELLPESIQDHADLPSNATQREQQDYNAWVEKIERAMDACKNKKRGNKQYKDMKRQMRISNDAKTLTRVQKYFGLISPTKDSKDAVIDLQKPAPYAFQDEPIFISADVESWEDDHSVITEIGLSTIDTADLIGLAPEEWHTRIRSRHFRIKGRERYVNHKFVNGHPENFQFGSSEFVNLGDAASIVDRCFQYPFSAGYENPGPDRDEYGDIVRSKPMVPPFNAEEQQKKRNVILVGHGIDGDIKYLSDLGCQTFNLHPDNHDPFIFLETVDTSVMHRAFTKSDQMTSLANMCAELDIDAFFLHNAGNDARYTLEACLRLALRVKPEPSVEKVVQAASPLFAEQGSANGGGITFEEANRRFLDRAGLGVNERVNQ